MSWPIRFLAAFAFLGALDFVWFKWVSGDFFYSAMKPIARVKDSGFDVHFPSALVVYALLAAGLVFFVRPESSGHWLDGLGRGALFGLITYGVYDFTNHAVLAHWPVRLILVDVLWGAFSLAVVSVFMFFTFGAEAKDMASLKVGDQAPAFLLKDQDGQEHKLADHKGKWLVLYFYPKDDTPGCTKQACSIRDGIGKLKEKDIRVYGVSVDSVESHKKFAEKHKLNFPLLADVDKSVTKAYGALSMLRMANRYTFIIDPEQKVAKILTNVDVKAHADEIISEIEALK